MDSNNSKKVPTPKTTSWFNPCAGNMRWDSLDSIILALTLIWAEYFSGLADGILFCP
jgi:hypothetical protein